MAFPVGWNLSNKITIQSGQVPTSLSNREVMINKDIINLSRPEMITLGDPDSALSSGADIRISTDALGATQCPVEIVQFELNANPLLSKVVIYTKLPTVADSTEFYIWWKNGSAVTDAPTDPFGRNNVWTSYNTAVYHNEEDISVTDLINSKGNGFTGSPSNSVRLVGNTGNASDLSNSDSFIAVPDTGSALQIPLGQRAMFSWWQKLNNIPTDTGRVLSTFTKGKWIGYPGSPNISYGFRQWASRGGLEIYYWSGSWQEISITSNNLLLNDTDWHHILIAFELGDQSTIKCFVDGVDETGITNWDGSWTASPVSNSHDLDIGALFIDNLSFPNNRTNPPQGQLDEIRISISDSKSNTQLASWEAVSYNNENCPTLFMVMEGATVLLNPTVLLTPVDTAVDVPIPVAFDWEPVSCALDYTIEVSLVPDPEGIIFYDTVDNLASLTLNSDTTYYWRMKAVNGLNESTFTTYWSFTTELISTPLDSPVLVSPPDTSVDQLLNVILDWNSVTNGLNYFIQVATDFDFVSVEFSNTTTSTSAQFALSNSIEYFWRVRALGHDAFSDSNYSSIRSFTTESTPPPIPILLTPISGSILTSDIVEFRWEEELEALSYHLQVATDIGFTDIFADINDNLVYFGISSGVVSTEIAGFTPNITYYWRVRANSSETGSPPPPSS